MLSNEEDNFFEQKVTLSNKKANSSNKKSNFVEPKIF